MKIFEELGLHEGRMISGSKSFYHKKNPNHDVLFNANIFKQNIIGGKKVWWGDLDLTLDAPVIQEIANKTGAVLYVVAEIYGRFGSEKRPFKKIKGDAHARFTPYQTSYEVRDYTGEIKFTKIGKMHVGGIKNRGWKEVKL